MTQPIRTELAVLDNIPYGSQEYRENFFALRLTLPEWKEWLPGQFVMISPYEGAKELTWARPLSICRVTKREMVLFFQVVGRGTQRLAKLKAHDRVIMWGPLGNGFCMEEARSTLLIAGGIGIAPFLAYVESHPNPNHLSMLFGHRVPVSCYPLDSFMPRISVETVYEHNEKTLVMFQKKIEDQMIQQKKRQGLVLACGPLAFLKFVHKVAIANDVRTQLSLETKMACGVGACLGCVSKTSKEWPEADKAGLPVQTCTAGPVFWANELDLS